MIVEEHSPGYEPQPEEPRRRQTMKELDADLQPQEKAVALGSCEALSNVELLALLLRSGLPGKPITEICRELIRANDGSLRRLFRRSRSELLAIKGFGKVKAIQIEAVATLINRFNSEAPQKAVTIGGPADIDNVMRPRLGNLDHEEIWVLMLNRRNQVIKMSRVSVGGYVSSVFDVKKILKEALLENTQSLVMCHNHPSGSLVPSPQDDAITDQLKRGCDAVAMFLMDHIVLSSEGFYSYADHGKL